MESRPEVLVVGAGIMGLCTAFALRAQGARVRVVDAVAAPNPHASSVDHHRLIRHSYGAQHGYMRMVDDAYLAWSRIFAALGEAPYVETGVLALDEGVGTWLPESRAAMRAHGLTLEDLSAPALPARFPWMSDARVVDAFFCARGGVLLARRIVELLAARIAPGIARVREVHDGAVTLEDGTRQSADMIVVAAGPWAPRLLPGIAQRVTASRQIIVRLAPPPALAEAWSRAPMLLDLSELGGFYMVPPVAGTPIKIGDHSFSRQGDADDPRPASAAEAEAILGLARHRIPDLEHYTPLGAMACYYDVESREEFVVDMLSPRSVVMSGFSGHGFKFGSVLGQAVANAIINPALRAALPDWAAGRIPPPPGLLESAA
ncbi:MAG: FAD-dependent oxidoreductase [Alphaproteobacteria bacterium]|nr:FAD-dependent oxidoreductase [Alphaproteobacteria bacterium]